MSGEASSNARAPKRQRGQTPPAQDQPTEQAEPSAQEPPRREITYSEPERSIVVQKGTLREHTLLQFALGTKGETKCANLINTELLVPKVIDWDLLDVIGQRDRIERLLGPRFKRVLECDKPQYEELTIEFHSTWRHKEGAFDEPDAVSFSLGRILHEMTIPQFAVLTGYYTADEVQSPGFCTSLRGAYKVEREYCLREADLIEFWDSIATSPFSTQMVGSEIRDPVYRFIHKILSNTLVGRGSRDNKVNWIDLFCLYCMVRGREANLASVMAWSFSRTRRGGSRAGLDMGPYITRIVENLKVLSMSRYTKDRLVKGPKKPVRLEVKELKRAGIFTWTEPLAWVETTPGPQVPPPEGTLAAETRQASIPTGRQRPRQRHELPGQQHPLREPPPPAPLTLQGLSERMDRRIDELRDLILEGRREQTAAQHRHEDALRHIMGQMHIPIPDYLAAPEPA